MNSRPITFLLLPLCFFLFFFMVYAGGKVFLSSTLTTPDYAGPSENLFNLRVPRDLNFAGEPIPQNDYSIKENMEKVMNGGNFEKSTAYILFSRAASWFPLIEKILKKNHIPDDFKYIALAESRLTNSTSPQGAAGFWQFIPSTGSYFGLEINNDVDERLHVEKSTEAACRFFKEAYRKLGNWTLVAAAYNMGMGGIEYHMKKQPSKNYYDLLMNKETSAYIYRVLALKTVFLNANKKFYGGNNIYSIPSRLFKTDSSITNLAAFAAAQGCSYEVLKVFNPWLISEKLSNTKGKTYHIRLPKKEFLKKFMPSNMVTPDSARKDTIDKVPVTSDTLHIETDSTGIKN